MRFARAETLGEEGAFTRIDETHPVGIFLGLEDGKRAVMVVCPRRPPSPPLLAAIEVTIRLRNDEQWAIVLRLLRPELKNLFTRLVEDLDAATRTPLGDPGSIVIERLSRWKRLLSPGTLDVLEDKAVRGLAAELSFLLHEGFRAIGARSTVLGWVGPYERPKDFILDHAEIEVKAVGRQFGKVTISSLEQLSLAGLPLFLWCQAVDIVSTPSGDAISLASLIDRIRGEMVDDSIAAQVFEEALRASGYEDRKEYQERLLRFGATRCYRVCTDFPRLERAQLAPAIVTCRYTIDLQGIEPFRAVTWTEDASNV